MAAALDRDRIARLVSEHQRGAADHRVALWGLLALDAWARVFLGPGMRPERLPGRRRIRWG